MSKVQGPYELPESWAWTTFGESFVIGSGSTPSTKNPANFGGSIPWITPADLSGFEGKFISTGSRNLTDEGLESCSARLLPKGTVVFSSRAPIGYVAIAVNDLCTNQGCKNFIIPKGIFNEYIYYYLRGNRDLAESYASGTTFLELSAKRAAMIPLPLPPLPEQHRIVAKIEELFTQLDAGVSALDKSRAQLKRYRQSVLKAAVEGKLTEEWRRSHPDVEPASVLLERIEQENEKSEKGRRKKLPPLGTSDLPELPDAWKWVNFGEIVVESQNGIAKRRSDHGTPTHVLRLSDILDYKISKEAPRDIMLTDDEIEKYALQAGDLLCIRVNGSPNNTGKMIIFDQSETWGFCDHFIKFRLFDEFVLSNYLSQYFNTKIARDHVEFNMVSSAGQNTVSQMTMFTTPIPLPPLTEQQEIVSEVERRLSVSDNTEAALEANLKRAARLRQSILKKAFRGELVPQDPNDEPASVLLDRIKAERSQSRPANNRGQVTRGRGRPRKNAAVQMELI